REAIAQLQTVVKSSPDFDPRTATTLVRVAASDYVCAVLLPKLWPRLSRQAPYLRLAVADFSTSDPIQDLRSGQIDLLIGAFSKTGTDIHRYDLFTDEWVCVARKGHPQIRERLSVKQF